MSEVQSRKLFPTSESCEDVFWSWERILVYIQNTINSDLVVAADPYSAVFLGDRNNRGCPITVVDFFQALLGFPVDPTPPPQQVVRRMALVELCKT